jgi:hypothetical protein
MDAPILRGTLVLLSLFISTGANYQTPNFTVTAPDPQVAKQVGDAAEIYRRDMAIFWLGEPLPNWSRPCTLKVRDGAMGAGGETKFQFVNGEVLNWNMYVQGSLERILDSVLPHEVNHTIFACHFRRPLPRWADEGAATLFEHRSEQVKQLGLLKQVLNSDREFISLRHLLTMKDYPKGYRPMLILYAEGYALADFLVQQGGRAKYLKLMADGERMGWTQAIRENYHHGGVDELQKNWRSWILAGMPTMKEPTQGVPTDTTVASGLGVPRPRILDEYLVNTTVRSQSPGDSETFAIKPAVVTERTPPAVRTVQDSSSLKDAVFFNEPGAKTINVAGPAQGSSAVSNGQFRAAGFEAPLPRPGSGTRQRPVPAPVTSETPRSVPAGSPGPFLPPRQNLEATGLTDQFFNQPNSRRKHLPQERRAETGSIPQWAGFPGQKELF